MSNVTRVKPQVTRKSKFPVHVILFGAGFCTLYFNPSFQDPFSAPKFWILMILASWMTGYLLTFRNYNLINSNAKRGLYLTISFISLLLLSTFNTDLKYTALFGEYLRRNGFITYLCFGILLISSMLYFKLEDYKLLVRYSYLIIIFLLTYGLMQLNGKDFVTWNNPYNSIISTVGNPNFAAAIFAIITLISLGPVFMSDFPLRYRIISAVIYLLSIYTILKSDARQGLIAIAIGSIFYFTVWLYSWKKRLGILAIGSSSVLSILAILGMLQEGPLKNLLYKESVSVRGYYWRAGISMLKDQPALGIGVDRYGSFFKEFREVQYPIKYGFDITSTNAHNVPIQIFATSGLFVGLLYLLVNIFILFMIFQALRKSNGNSRLIIASISSAWLAYQAQSVISIDNIGVAIWGWVLGGIILALSTDLIYKSNHPSDSNKSIKNSLNKLSQPLISGILVISTCVFVSVLIKGETNMLQTRLRFNPSVEANKIPLQEFANKTINTPLIDPTYKIMSASYLVNTGYINEGISALNKVLEEDPRNQDVLGLLAVYSQQLGNIEQAINFRLSIAKIDPWNAENYFQLGKIYRDLGNHQKMVEYLNKIESFAGMLDIANQAKLELVVK